MLNEIKNFNKVLPDHPEEIVKIDKLHSMTSCGHIVTLMRMRILILNMTRNSPGLALLLGTLLFDASDCSGSGTGSERSTVEHKPGLCDSLEEDEDEEQD